jgi:hypothetical protein
MDYQTFSDTLTGMLVRFGFPCNPLTEGEMRELYDLGASVGDAYGVVCDVHAEIELAVAIAYNCDAIVDGTKWGEVT